MIARRRAPSCGTPSSNGCNPPRNTARSTPTSIFYARSAARSMMRRLSFTFFPFPTPRQRRLRARTSIAISIPSPVLTDTSSTTRPFLSRRAFTDSTPSRRRDARARRPSSTGIAARRYLLGGISTTSTHLVRPSVRSRRDATRSPGSMRATTTMTRGRARVDASAPVRATTTRAEPTRGAARDRATDARGGRRERAIGGVFE